MSYYYFLQLRNPSCALIHTNGMTFSLKDIKD